MKYIRFKELRKSIPLGRTTIWRMMRSKKLFEVLRLGSESLARGTENIHRDIPPN